MIVNLSNNKFNFKGQLINKKFEHGKRPYTLIGMSKDLLLYESKYADGTCSWLFIGYLHGWKADSNFYKAIGSSKELGCWWAIGSCLSFTPTTIEYKDSDLKATFTRVE